jgi:putative oxidoreductase
MPARLDVGLLLLRVATGLGMATHGYAKIFGGFMDKFTAGVAEMGFPAPAFFAWAAALSEFVGAICLALGLGTRVAAFFIAVTMVVAAFVRGAGKAFADRELALLYLVLCATFLVVGGGRFAVERLWRKATA